MPHVFELPNVFDFYERRARVYPAIIVGSPLIVAVLCNAPAISEHGLVGGAVSGVLVLAFLYFLSLAVRYAGRKLEPALWKSWGGPPSTRLLLWSDKKLSNEFKVLAHSVVKSAVGITLPTADEELADPTAARQRIWDAFRIMRAALDNEKPKGPHRIHNAEYGFARNLLGASPYGQVIAAIAAGASVISAWVRWTWLPLLAVGFAAVVFALLLMAERKWLKPMAKLAADWYAEKAWTTFIEMRRSSQGANA